MPQDRRELKQDPVDPKKVRELSTSGDPSVRRIAEVVEGSGAADEILEQIEAGRARLADVDDAAAYARERVAAISRGDEPKASDLQLVSALSSDEAMSGAQALRKSGRIADARHDVQRVTGVDPDIAVVVMADEMSTVGLGSGVDHGTYIADARCVVVVGDVSDHTLRHELVHATQPRQVSGGSRARLDMIEGTTDALTLEAGSDSDDLSYAREAAAILAWGEALGRDRLEWLRQLSATTTPEDELGKTLHSDARGACDAFLDAKTAAEGWGREFTDRVQDARRVVQARLSEAERSS